MYKYWATVLNVDSADLLELEVDLGFNVSTRIFANLYGVETYGWGEETKFEAMSVEDFQDKAKNFVEEWLEKNTKNNRVIIWVHKGNNWEVEVMTQDPTWVPNLNRCLVEAGFSKFLK